MSEQAGNFVVAHYLGHCGAPKNRYVVFEGTKKACEDHIVGLLCIEDDQRCSYCGGYTGTNPVQECSYTEEGS